MQGKIKCDKCNWGKYSRNVEGWHNKKCPDCKDSVIINDDDMTMIKTIDALADAGLVKKVSKEEASDCDGIVVSINTAGLRKN